MKKTRFLLALFFFLTLFSILAFNSKKRGALFAQQYSCENRNPGCPEDEYPNCQTAVGECNPPGCLVGMYLKEGSYVLDCAYPLAIIPPPPESNYCGWDSNNNPIDKCVLPYVADREENPTTGERSCICVIPPSFSPTPFPQNRCPVCSEEGYYYHSAREICCQKCDTNNEKVVSPAYIDCSGTGKSCVPGCGCGAESCQTPFTPFEICNTVEEESVENCKKCFSQGGAWTALGCIPTEPMDLVKWLFPYLLGFGGLAAFGLIVYSGFRLMTSSGDPQKIQGAKETITAAITGLIFIILSLFLLRLIGVNILGLPGLE